MLLSSTNLSGTGTPPRGQGSPDATLLLQQTYVSTYFPSSPKEEDFGLMKKRQKAKTFSIGFAVTH